MSGLSFSDLFIRCSYCAKPISKFQRTIDHVIPVSKGGTEDVNNKVWSCRSCNQKKKDLLPREWLQVLEEEYSKTKHKNQLDKIKKQINSILKYAGK
jgi:5-methylcytosine-specific restriction endonuclease McrA